MTIDDLEDLAHRLAGWFSARYPERAPVAEFLEIIKSNVVCNIFNSVV